MVTTIELLRFIYKVREGEIPQDELHDEATRLLTEAGYLEDEEG